MHISSGNTTKNNWLNIEMLTCNYVIIILYSTNNVLISNRTYVKFVFVSHEQISRGLHMTIVDEYFFFITRQYCFSNTRGWLSAVFSRANLHKYTKYLYNTRKFLRSCVCVL